MWEYRQTLFFSKHIPWGKHVLPFCCSSQPGIPVLKPINWWCNGTLMKGLGASEGTSCSRKFSQKSVSTQERSNCIFASANMYVGTCSVYPSSVICDNCDMGVYVSCVSWYLSPAGISQLLCQGVHAANDVSEGQRWKGTEDWPSKNKIVVFNR